MAMLDQPNTVIFHRRNQTVRLAEGKRRPGKSKARSSNPCITGSKTDDRELKLYGFLLTVN
jgi:hypothetical protein